jgi:DNA-binding response OmpR family regulator
MDDTRETLLARRRAHPRGPARHLAADGYEPLGAQSEQDTRSSAITPPALLVLGRLSGARGQLALLRAVRSGEAGGDRCLPVIVLGQQGELELLRAFEAGCDQFVPKPFSYLDLRARVRAYIQRSRQWQQPRAAWSARWSEPRRGSENARPTSAVRDWARC